MTKAKWVNFNFPVGEKISPREGIKFSPLCSGEFLFNAKLHKYAG